MRIISGSAKRLGIKVPRSLTRPSTDRLREALFSILGNRVEGAQVLDLFAGSGALGMEALSRGADSCDFVDSGREAAVVIKGNLKHLSLKGGRVTASEVERFLRRARPGYDLVFADPPYFKGAGDTDYIEALLVHDVLPELVVAGGLLVLEDPPAHQRPDTVEGKWELLERRRYGSCGILIYQRVGSE